MANKNRALRVALKARRHAQARGQFDRVERIDAHIKAVETGKTPPPRILTQAQREDAAKSRVAQPPVGRRCRVFFVT